MRGTQPINADWRDWNPHPAEQYGFVVIDGRTTWFKEDESNMEVLTEVNGWAIVWMHNKYFVRHTKPEGCGTFLRANATKGCTCRGKNKETKKVDDTILAKFRILTLRENLK